MSEVTTLGRLVAEDRLILRDGYRTRKSELGEPGVPILRVADVAMGSISPSYADFVSERFRSKFGAKTSQPGDVVVTTKGTVGRVAQIGDADPEMVYSPQLCFFRAIPGGGVLPDYLRYWFQGPEFRAQALGVQAQTDMAAYINLADMRGLRIELPAEGTQSRVAEILRSLDEKINLNESVAQKSLGCAQLGFEWSLGIEGAVNGWAWPLETLGDWLEVAETGKRPIGGVGRFTSGVPSIGAESIVRAGVFNYSKVKFVPREFFEAMRKGVLQDGDILLYKDGGTPGNFEPHVSMFGGGFPFSEAAINEHVFRLRIKSPFSQAFLYCWLSTDWVMEEMRRRGTGVAIPGLSRENLRAVPVIVPDPQVLGPIQEEAEAFLEVVLRCAQETRALAAMRDALLPELLSGRLSVPEAEELVSEVT